MQQEINGLFKGCGKATVELENGRVLEVFTNFNAIGNCQIYQAETLDIDDQNEVVYNFNQIEVDNPSDYDTTDDSDNSISIKKIISINTDQIEWEVA